MLKIKVIIRLITIIFIIAVINLSNGYSQNRSIDSEMIMEVVDTCIQAFKTYYVYPEKLVEVEKYVRSNIEKGKYNSITSKRDLCRQIIRDFRSITRDRHIWIDIMKNIPAGNDKKSKDREIAENQITNFGFVKFELLKENVAYLRIDGFIDLEYAKETAAAAMNMLGNSKSIILDLRFNHGGNKNMVHFISSYFFKNKTQLNSLYFREADSLVTAWTFPDVPGKKLIEQKLYILTGRNSASAAEAFAYLMKNYKRAVIIGDKTAGAAHWAEYYKYPDLDIFLKIPVARPINPITKKDWEGVGVIPDLEIPESKALEIAYLRALKDIEPELTDINEKEDLLWYIKLTELKQGTSINKRNDLKEYTGNYSNGKLSFIYKEEKLYWKDSDDEYVLLPLSNDAFVFSDTEDYIMQFLRNEEDKIYGMQYFEKNSKEHPIYKKTGDI